MEDAHTCRLELTEDKKAAYFAVVYDVFTHVHDLLTTVHITYTMHPFSLLLLLNGHTVSRYLSMMCLHMYMTCCIHVAHYSTHYIYNAPPCLLLLLNG